MQSFVSRPDGPKLRTYSSLGRGLIYHLSPMARNGLRVMKFGGSSVADADKIKHVAHRVAEAREAGDDVLAVVSARGKTTDELVFRNRILGRGVFGNVSFLMIAFSHTCIHAETIAMVV